MKKLFLPLLILSLASCKKECFQTGHIVLKASADHLCVARYPLDNNSFALCNSRLADKQIELIKGKYVLMFQSETETWIDSVEVKGCGVVTIK